MAFKVGDRVKVVDANSAGTVLKVAGDRVTIEDTHGFDQEFIARQLVLDTAAKEFGELEDTAGWLAGREERNDTLKKVEKLEARMQRFEKTRKAPDVDMEIDLHLHEIIDSERGMSDGEKVQYQIDYFERMLEKAIREKMKKVVFIHGIGKGRLREEIRRIMNYYTSVRYFDADHRKYGIGATEVHIQHI